MLSHIGNAAEIARGQGCSNHNLITHTCSPFCPIAHSMSFIVNAFTSRPASAKSMLSFTSTHASSMLEESTTEELSDGEFHCNDTRATSVTTVPGIKRSSTSSVKNKPKTVFHLAHPPPISIHKQHLHIRPRVLLQLQSITETARPTPALEVLPSFIFASRLARRFPRTFKGKAGLGADDLVVVSSENYKLDGSETGDIYGNFETEKWDEREIVAAICQPVKDEADTQGKTQICLNNGSLWTVSRLASGAYEFVTVDEHGLRTVARWVPKQPRNLPRASTTGRERSASEEKRFNFSLLNPNSRRHAIIASLDRHSIDVSAQYIDPSTPPKEPDSPTPTTSCSSTSGECPPKTPIEVSQSLRTLITVTGICVAFHEGFSTHIRRSDNVPASPNLGTKKQHRSQTMSSNESGVEPPPSPALSSFGRGHRARAKLYHTNSSSAVPQSPGSNQSGTLPRRTMSTSGAFLQRIKSRNISGASAHHLSPVGDYDGDDTEKTPTRKSSRRLSEGSPLNGSVIGSHSGRDSPLTTVISSDVDTAEGVFALNLEASKKPRRLSRLFGLSRRTSGSGSTK